MFALITHFLRTVFQPGQADQVPNDLMEAADACAGIDPAEAARLRDAALRYLSVVR